MSDGSEPTALFWGSGLLAAALPNIPENRAALPSASVQGTLGVHNGPYPASHLSRKGVAHE